jgi:DNA topoisomerase-6 subunit B
MKLGEFITHAHLYPNITLAKLLTTAFSRVSEKSIKEFVSNGLPNKILTAKVQRLTQDQFKTVYGAIQQTALMAPSTQSVLTIGEESLTKSINRMGDNDFFAVVTRKPRICDFKPVVIEVAIARFVVRGEVEEPVRVLRFANRVPLQFDKGNCAITKAIESVNWRSYGLTQPKSTVPRGPYVFAVSVVSPFIKFKNASKETIDASDELVDEIRLSLQQAGQRLSKHIKREIKAADLERKRKHIEKFGPILVDGLARITGAGVGRREAAEIGLAKILGRDTQQLDKALCEAEQKLTDMKLRDNLVLNGAVEGEGDDAETEVVTSKVNRKAQPKKKKAKKAAKTKAVNKKKAVTKKKTAIKTKAAPKTKKAAKSKSKVKTSPKAKARKKSTVTNPSAQKKKAKVTKKAVKKKAVKKKCRACLHRGTRNTPAHRTASSHHEVG